MKIGFLAISGIRAYNEKLNAIGVTLPGVIERQKIVASLPSLGLLTLAGMTPKKYERVYTEMPTPSEVKDLDDSFDLVAISSFSAQMNEAYVLADRFRALGVKVVLGGLHVTVMPEEAKAHADAVVVGEGELSWLQVLDDAERGELKPFYRADGRSFDLADAPMPAYELLDPPAYNRLTVQTSRGCPFRCDFCASSIVLTDTYKVKPAEKIIAEIRAIKGIWEKPFIEFADDNTFANKPFWRDLIGKVAAEKVPWFTESDISLADDEELMKSMRDSNCKMVLIGLESPRASSLDGLELKANWKLDRAEKAMEAVQKIQSHGIRVNGCFILGLDTQGPEVFDEVKAFVKESGLYEVQITFLTPFPKTPLYERLKSEGRILKDGAWELCTLFDINFTPKRMTVEELEDGFVALGEQLYSEDFVAARKESYRKWAEG